MSPDGRWWWDGQHWRSRLVEGRLDFFWFTDTPDWFARIAVTGLIGLIPIVGAIKLFGWTLTATEMVGNGWKELPPPGFQYLERGVNPFVVGFVYGVVFSALVSVLVVLDVLLGTSDQSRVALAIVVGVLIALLVLPAWAVYRRRLFALARANHAVSLRVALVYLLMGLALAVIVFPVALFIPFGGLLVWLVLPGLYATLVPSLAVFQVEPAPVPASP